jgi:glutamate dehydrogenase/leucine dehydrogenase
MSAYPEPLPAREPEFVCTVRDDNMGLLGHVVVHASIDGHACGGLRMFDTVCLEELQDLAKSMTLKYGFSGMRQGGAKAGIFASPELSTERRRGLLFRFGQLIAPLLRSGYYNPGPDMNTTAEDIEHMLSAAAVRTPGPRRGMGKKSGLYTGMSVMVAAEAVASVLRETLEGKTVAIEGFGSVGSALAMLMAKKKKARVVAISTTQGAIHNPAGLDVERLLDLRQSHGNDLVNAYDDADHIEKEELVLLDVDILSPCARRNAITEANVDKVRARIVCPGANNPITREAHLELFRRGVIVVPHFIANCGGVIGNKAEVLGVDEEFIEAFIRQRNFEQVRSLILRSREAHEAMFDIALREASNSFDQMRQHAARKSAGNRLRKAGLRAFNAGLVPKPLARSLAPWILARTM